MSTYFYSLIGLLCLLALRPSISLAQSEEWVVYDSLYAKDMIVDKQGRMWIAGFTTLSIYNNRTWTYLTPDNSPLPGKSLTELALDTQGKVWIGCYYDPYGCPLFSVDPSGASIESFQWKQYQVPVDNGSILSVAADSAGNVWAGSVESKLGHPGGLAIVNEPEWSFYLIPSDENLAWANALTTAPNGVLWAAIWKGHAENDQNRYIHEIYRLQDGVWTVFPEVPVGEDEGFITELAAGTNGVLWIGTSNRGIIHFDDTTWTTFDTTNSPLPSDWITALTLSADGTLWIGTDAGLIRYDGLDWTLYTSANSGLPLDYITALTIDTYGNLWVGTRDEAFEESKVAVFQPNGVVGLETEDASFTRVPVRLLPAYPNPFTDETTLSYDLNTPDEVTLRVFDVLGREIAVLAEGYRSAGRHSITFNGRGLSNGVYILRLETIGQTTTRLLTLQH